MTRVLIGIAICGACLWPATARAQVKAELLQAAGPVQILTAPGGQPQGWPGGLAARNNSRRQIETVVVGVELYAGDGTLQMTNIHAYTRLATSQGWAGPGAAIPMPLPRFNFTGGAKPATAKIWVDLVVFADGSTWGPNRLKQAARWKGIREGVLLERLHLRRILRRAGPKGVKAALAAAPVPAR